MKFKQLNNKVEKSEEKKKLNSFKKMLAVSATVLTLWGCDRGMNIDYDGWETTDHEVSDTDNNSSQISTYCDSSIVNKPFSNNVSLVKDESMYLFNRVMFTFEGIKNTKFSFKITPENSDSYNILLDKNKPLQIKNEKGEYNLLQFCSFDNTNELTVASNDNILPYIFKDEKTNVEEVNGNFNQLIYRTYFTIEGNTITNELLISEKNWVFPTIQNIENRETIKLNEENWLITDIGYDKLLLFKESAYYGGMSSGSDLLLSDNISLTYISNILEGNSKYIVFELKGDSIQKVVIPENEMISINFEGEKIVLFVKKIYDDFEGNVLCDLSVISKFIEFNKKESAIELELYGMMTKAYVNYSIWDNTTKLEIYPSYDFEKLIKRKERDE